MSLIAALRDVQLKATLGSTPKGGSGSVVEKLEVRLNSSTYLWGFQYWQESDVHDWLRRLCIWGSLLWGFPYWFFSYHYANAILFLLEISWRYGLLSNGSALKRSERVYCSRRREPRDRHCRCSLPIQQTDSRPFPATIRYHKSLCCEHSILIQKTN
jgi:hypothetical protein